MPAGLWAVLAGIVTLAIGILNEFFSAKARERVAQEAFDKRELEFDVLAQKALEKWHRDSAAAAVASQSGQDWLDAQINETKKLPNTGESNEKT